MLHGLDLPVATLLFLLVCTAALFDDVPDTALDPGKIQARNIISNEKKVLGNLPLRSESLLDRMQPQPEYNFPFKHFEQVQENNRKTIRKIINAKQIDSGSDKVIAFRVKEKFEGVDKMFVMKLFPLPNGAGIQEVVGNESEFVPFEGDWFTWEYTENDYYRHYREWLKRECDICMDLSAKANHFMQSDSNNIVKKGTNRIVKCVGHNFNGVSGNQPLYLKFEYVGEPLSHALTDLRKAKDVDNLAGLIKQLFEGLVFLDAAGWVHHNLKKNDLVVTNQTNGTRNEYALHFINFDSSVAPQQTNSTRYTRQQWRALDEMVVGPYNRDMLYTIPSEGRDMNFATCPRDGKDKCPYAFDVFSAGIIALEMACGKPLQQVLRGTRSTMGQDWLWDGDEKHWKYDRINDREAFNKYYWLLCQQDRASKELNKAFEAKVKGTSFQADLVKTLSQNPSDRPTALSILETDLMKNVTTPDKIQPVDPYLKTKRNTKK